MLFLALGGRCKFLVLYIYNIHIYNIYLNLRSKELVALISCSIRKTRMTIMKLWIWVKSPTGHPPDILRMSTGYLPDIHHLGVFFVKITKILNKLLNAYDWKSQLIAVNWNSIVSDLLQIHFTTTFAIIQDFISSYSTLFEDFFEFH